MNKFPWGKVIEEHVVGIYTIKEYLEYDFMAGAKPNTLTDTHSFAIYLNGEDMHESYPSLDAALIGCISTRNLGFRPAGLVAGICRALGVP